MARRQPICRPATQLSHALIMTLCLALLGCAEPQNAPSASPYKEPSAYSNKEPSAAFNEKPLASRNNEASAPSHKALAAAQFSGRNALRHIAAQVALGPRSPYHPRAKARTLDYIETHLKPLTTRIARQPFVRHGLNGTNVWASIDGSDGDGAGRLMLGAHWDTRPFADRDANIDHRQRPVLGANDGGSGVAVLLEVARVLQKQPARSSVDLLFFDFEDMGQIDGLPFSIGARAFVAAQPDYRVDGGAIIDMVCDQRLRIPREGYSNSHAPNVLDAIWQSAARQSATVFVDAPGVPIVDDHLPFLEAGIAVVDLIHYPFPSSWHTLNDRVENCSAANLAQVGRTLLDFIYHHGAIER
ncbi:MAG: M28 family peptidase [Cellvibrionales bacterium]